MARTLCKVHIWYHVQGNHQIQSYTVYIRFWPTLSMCLSIVRCMVYACMLLRYRSGQHPSSQQMRSTSQPLPLPQQKLGIGQNSIYTPYMTVHLVISLPKKLGLARTVYINTPYMTVHLVIPLREKPMHWQ